MGVEVGRRRQPDLREPGGDEGGGTGLGDEDGTGWGKDDSTVRTEAAARTTGAQTERGVERVGSADEGTAWAEAAPPDRRRSVPRKRREEEEGRSILFPYSRERKERFLPTCKLVT